jgi:hypothetical protein
MSVKQEILKKIARNPNIKDKIKSVDDFINSYNKVINKQPLINDLEKEIDYRINKQHLNHLWTIFMGCQKTKTFQIINRIKELISMKERSISIIICQNDASLSLQTSERLHKIIPINAKVFVLSSTINVQPNLKDDSVVYNPSFNTLISYILHYVIGKPDYLYPVIVSLNNEIQMTKIINILKVLQKPILNAGYHLFIDEADRTYHNIRNSLLPFIMKNEIPNETNIKNYGTYWITATGYSLVKGRSSYNECKKAHQMDIILSPDIDNIYFDITDKQAIIHKIPANNFKIVNILEDNKEHFKSPLKDGSYRKIIAVGSHVTEYQEMLANQLVHIGYNVLTINTNGILLHLENNLKQKWHLGKEISEVNKLIAIKYNENTLLHNKPFIIVGNRKIDRGITFHYPSNDNNRLIFTDMLIPEINNWKRAIQIAGRCAGIIKNEGFSDINYWIEEKTYNRIIKYIKYTDKRLESPIGYKTIEELLL